MQDSRKGPYVIELLRGIYRHTGGKIAIWGIGAFVFLALSADFLANDRPVLCSYQNEVYSPVLQLYAPEGGMSSRPEVFGKKEYEELKYEWAIWPLVPYGPEELHLDRDRTRAPFTRNEGIHILGTDALGRDVLSGLIHGSRTALAIAFLSMGLAFLVGVAFGIGAAYFGDSGLGIYPDVLVLCIAGLIFLSYSLYWFAGFSILLPIILIAVTGGYAYVRDRWVRGGVRRLGLPVDGTVLRLMELLRAIPDLFLLLAALAIIRSPGIWQIALLIGLLRWPSIARYVRAETLRIRTSPFIEVARMQGKSNWRIIWTYLLPNVIGPALIAVVFGMSSAILIEASLSFLGIGLPANAVTWGSMMSEARDYMQAWWLAVFPGLCIFLLIWMLNYAADALLNELQTERMREPPHF